MPTVPVFAVPRSFPILVLAVLGLLSASARLDAGIIFNTLDDTQDGLVSLSAANSRWYAQLFSTTANEVEISQVRLDLQALAVSDVEVLIYTDSSGVPGSQIGQPLYSANQTIVSPLVIAGLSINLSPSTDYWLVTTRNGGDTVFWGYTDDVAFTNALTSNGGANWTTSPTAPLRMEVTAVPEPASMQLLVSGAILAGARQVVRRRASRA